MAIGLYADFEWNPEFEICGLVPTKDRMSGYCVRALAGDANHAWRGEMVK